MHCIITEHAVHSMLVSFRNLLLPSQQHHIQHPDEPVGRRLSYHLSKSCFAWNCIGTPHSAMQLMKTDDYSVARVQVSLTNDGVFAGRQPQGGDDCVYAPCLGIMIHMLGQS